MDSSATLNRPVPPPPPPSARRPPYVREKRRRRPSAQLVESLAVFAVFAAVYFVVGYQVVVKLNLVNFDSLSRLAHAYFVWYNDPPKLAAIGFVWPPVQTLIYLPFALVKPLATSLAALPAASATFMAATLVVVNHAFRATEMPWFGRWPLLLAFGLNPMILYYGANGMAEAVYLFFLVFGVYFLIRWRQTGANHLLAFVGLGVALSMLSRYEIVPFAALIAGGLAVVVLSKWKPGNRARALESALVLYLAPVLYFGMTWLFFNWLILGDPMHFLGFGPTTADLSTSQQDVGGAEANEFGPASIAVYLVKLNFALFPLTVVAGLGLLVTAVLRRNPMALVLAGLVATNAIVTALLFLQTADPNLLQLRYNMRAMPLALLGVAWLYYVWRPRPARLGIWVATLAIMVGSFAITWRTMETYTYQYEENVFLRALETGEDQEGNTGIGGYPIGIAAERDMADYISDNVAPDEVILTDDAQSLGVMLLSGHPDRFFDRIDRGEGPWLETLDDPWGGVEYLLVATNERCRPPCVDLVRERYNGILRDEVAGMRIVFETDRYALIEVDPRRPEELSATTAEPGRSP